jgi:hypothetical protein
MLNPFSRRRLPQVPSILQVIMLSMLANRRPDLQLCDSDILIKPELPDDLRFTSLERHNEIFLHAYRGVASWIQIRLAEDGSKALAMITASRSSTATSAVSDGAESRGDTNPNSGVGAGGADLVGVRNFRI